MFIYKVHKYLLMTGQQLEIDMFNFDWWVQVLFRHMKIIPIPNSFSQVFQTFEPSAQVLKDISYGKEDVPVSAANSVDNSLPEYIEYSKERLPQNGVNDIFTCACFHFMLN